MLRVKNVSKIYTTKNNTTYALNNVSVDFPDTGMVFILGKSGSGKSTLLNICGGLDSPTSGEIIIDGKGSKDFKSKDFDGYRNTYIGFIFQEYNILNEFSVEDNISIALELQGKPKDKVLIDSILAQVDLQDFAKRKPNTLSGGQKQRVAIARALVKNPEIIFADEPTGALDSETGRQVFETLKKLSKDKLVIVVSHDREFAEEYGDRIIELKDGEIISDVSVSEAQEICEEKNLSFVNDETLIIRKGSKLTEQDIEKINKFLSQSEQSLVLSKKQKDVEPYLSDNNMTVGSKSFTPTNTEAIASADQAEQTYHSYPSKLPLRHAAKLGISGIKAKPLRFAFTILLSVISFVMFGLFSTVMFYNADKTAINSMSDADRRYVLIGNEYDSTSYYLSKTGTNESLTKNVTYLSPKDAARLKDIYGDKIIFTYALNETLISNITPNDFRAYNFISGFIPADSPVEYVHGRAPEKANEIAISEYTFNIIKNSKYINKSTDKEETITEYKDGITLFLNKKLTLYVCGVYKSSPYEDKGENIFNTTGYMQSDLYAYGVITDACYKWLKNYFGSPITIISNFNKLNDYYCTNPDLIDSYESVVHNISEEKFAKFQTDIFYFDAENASLQKNEIAVSFGIWYSLFFDDYKFGYETGYLYELRNNEQAFEEYKTLRDENNLTLKKKIEILSDNSQDDSASYSTAQLNGFLQDFIDFSEKYGFRLQHEIYLNNKQGSFSSPYTVKGFFHSDFDNNIVLNESEYYNFKSSLIRETGSFTENYTEYRYDNTSKYYNALIRVDGDKNMIEDIFKLRHTTTDEKSNITVLSADYTDILRLSDIIGSLSQIFLWSSIIMAIFSMILFFNFISVSISYKKHDIGLLRAVGAKSSDVFSIFMIQSLIVVIVCVLLAILITGIICPVINYIISSNLNNIFINVFDFGIVSVCMISGIALLSAFIATFIPVYNFSKKKPVETIRSL